MNCIKSGGNSKYDLLLVAVIIVRSSAYLFSKMCLSCIGPFTLLAMRFLLAFFLLVVIFWRKLKEASLHTMIRGVALGAVFFAVMTSELLGLRTTDSSTASFLENSAIIFVPLIEAMLHKRLPRLKTLFCCVLTLTGIGLLSVKNGRFELNQGEFLCLLSAAFYSVAIIITDRFSHKDNPLVLGVFQVGTIGFLGALSAFTCESPPLPLAWKDWFSIAYLAIVCTGFGFTLQPLAQSHTSSEKTGMFCTLNPLTASILGMVFLRERFTPTSALGAIIIIFSIILYVRKDNSKCCTRCLPRDGKRKNRHAAF